LRKQLTDAVEDEEARALLDPDRAGRRAAVAQDLRDHRVGAFVLLPHADVVRELDQLARA
jgi:hypothetical protein